ncbi:DAK2 domain-containing protein [Mediterraneibacter faecis]|uniref:DAK2 domain-containing protein n=1 Tax=Mediterraneibacter faecis TaxID=592978 RepID=UPI001D08AAFB|nr:DAK2 domain-containing protein [Mediterraneibacter faecis]MCB5919017.1 DAK2 domain-containing protein [Lachnospiraceae bacterium 210521-DFI.1.105]MCB6297000.1 DAK2 domain-containing protein [Mediterraneibacter faecis]MCB6443795.1 DAK2 domain-containing protein [Mediterraneibacter faecis]MCQ5255719.1 DAK2 domain-containing protein [Mediterraneibacter faecis]MCQ5258754.1 DAK2 domain-containing protein [Mediterraneibacter faecis]
MAVKTINTELLQKMFLAGAANLEAKKEFINELNVFPVPDGDTGTNMTLTILSAAKEVKALENPDMVAIAKAISSGSLRGARGNSGVILSQLLRGFTKEIREHKEIDTITLAKACERATATAYKAVMKPKEGTILTVAKGASQKAAELAETTEDLDTFILEVINYAQEVLEKTPEMLPVLKEAGVVDSGGQGLLEVMRGAYDAFQGKEIDYSAIEASAGTKMVKPSEQAETEIKFGYCTEFIIMLEKEFTAKDETEFKAYLESIGDSIVCVADDDIVKIHVHTNDPGLAIQRALTYGQLSRMKIDNMREEHQERLIKDAEKLAAQQAEAKKAEPRKEVGFIAVSIGEGMNEIFRELGADYIIEGGQTMNPSTEDMLNAIDQVNAEHIFILPNNKNIILAANQAQILTEDKDIIVVPSKTVPQGITAIINYMPDADAQTNLEAMIEGIGNVKTGQVTYAVRDTHIDDKEIHEGDIMGIGDSGILAVGQSVEETTKEMLAQLVDEDTELISLYYGQDVQEESAENFAQEIEDLYPDVDVDVHSGGQPIYYYVLSVE